MKATKPTSFGILFVISVTALSMTVALFAQSPEGEKSARRDEKPTSTDSIVADESKVPLAVARDRGKVMHEIYTVTLDVIHHRYFHGERAVIPARALEDVFSEIKRQSDVDARWISVNLKAMSITHEPKTEFEKKAAKEIASGKSEFEEVEDGFYRRAGAIRLTSGCIGCHGGLFKEQEKTPKYAALVISIPVTSDSGKIE